MHAGLKSVKRLRASAVFFLIVGVFGLGAEEPPLTDVFYTGGLPFSEKAAAERLDHAFNKPFNPDQAEATSLEIQKAWRLKNHPLAKVSWKAYTNLEKSGIVADFISEPGPRGKLKKISFGNNQSLSSKELSKVVSVRPRKNPWSRFSGADLVFLEDLISDQQTLVQHYRDQGYRDVQIGTPSLDWDQDFKAFHLHWPILNEGPQYQVGKISFSDPQGQDLDELAQVLGLTAGDTATPLKLSLAQERLHLHLLTQGYASAKAEYTPSWNEGGARVDLDYSISLGLIPTLDTVTITGNQRTQKKAIRKFLPLRSGDRFNPMALVQAQRDLEELGIFAATDMQYLSNSNNPLFNLEVNVVEKESGRAEAGLSYGSVEGAAILMRIIENNLALFPPGRGSALRGSLTGVFGSEITKAEISVLNPRLGRSRWSLGGRAFYEDNAYVSEVYDQKSHGFDFFFTHPIGRKNSIALGYEFTDFSLYNVNTNFISTVSAEESDLSLTSLTTAWRFESVDQHFRPTKGFRMANSFSWGTPALGGDTEALQYEGKASLFINPFREQVLIAKAGIKSVQPQGSTKTVPVPLRTWLGGAGNLHGFDYNSVSPMNEQGVPIGGESAWWAAAEYLIPLLSRIDLALYYEMGDVSPEAWKFSGNGPVSDWGFGFLIRAENFPVRIDVAFPLEVLENDRENKPGDTRLSFSAGYTF